MADKTISALTAASTPLAGTEVLPIVQSNTTKKVSVANLTAGRAISSTGVTVLLGDTSDASVNLQNSTGLTVLTQGGDGNFYFLNYAAKDIIFGTSGAELARFFNSSKDLRLTAGNLAFQTAGKGIDFSANTAAPGATSELLTRYEEGAYTATMTPTTSGTITLAGTHNTLTYTRVGRMVTVMGMLMVDTVGSPVGAININLPIAAAAGNSFNSAVALFVNGSNGPLSADFIGQVSAGASTMTIYLGDGNYVQSDSADAMQASTQVTISATYFA